MSTLPEKYYLDIGNATDSLLKSPRERALFRFFEMLPGALAWLTLIAVTVCSWLAPVFVAIFIIVFDIYWLLKTIFLSLHLRASYQRMKIVFKTDWLAFLQFQS